MEDIANADREDEDPALRICLSPGGARMAAGAGFRAKVEGLGLGWEATSACELAGRS